VKSFIKYSDDVRSRYYIVLKNWWFVFEINDEYLWFSEENFTRKKLYMMALKLYFGTGQMLEMFPVFGQMFCRFSFVWADSYMNSIFFSFAHS
jgi:hypothetical protein